MRILLVFSVLISFSLTAQASLFGGIPSSIKKALEDAHGTGNSYVLEAVVKYTKDTYPTYEDKIDGYVASISKKEEEKKVAAAAAKIADKSPYSGNIDASVNIANGNTKNQNMNASSILNYEAVHWSNTLKISTRASKEDSVRTNEEYAVNNQSRYNVSDRGYAFLELEYVNDRFSGYQYRNSELLGYGHKFWDTDDLKISGEASVGARQSHLTDNTKENTLLGKVGAKASWNMTDKITFDQDINSSFGSDAVITVWDSALKTKIVDSIYLKLNYNLQHTDTVPAGKKQIDSLTSLGVGYEF